ncbi:MAG: serine/threonine-protein kinase [Verrucomicrobiae bacterium]|nr:serine/threonine-protein kinase [Verrucomicrobiae bacterium]
MSAIEKGKVILDRFEVLEKLGQGGMGQVWKAFDRELREEVAIKIIAPEYAQDPICVRQLKDEVRRGRKLGHPNIVRLYEFFAVENDDLVFITMECVKGRNISHLRAQQEHLRFAEEQVEPWLRQIAAALDYAHGQEIIHRDIKPSNILIAGDGVAKLADFGISIALSESATRVTRNTSGTPSYMSPEQIQGYSLTPQSDLYSLGCTLFELLCGRPPYQSGSVDNVIRQHLEGHLPPPNMWPVALSARMTGILKALLQRTPQDRPARAMDLVKYLDGEAQALEPKPVIQGAAPPPLPISAPKASAQAVSPAPRSAPVRHSMTLPWGILAGAGIAVVALLLLAGLGWGAKALMFSGGSLANDEIISQQKRQMDSDQWMSMMGQIAGADTLTPLEKEETRASGMKISKPGWWQKMTEYPHEGAVQSALLRRLPPELRLKSLEPVARKSEGGVQEFLYRVTLTPQVPLYLVPVTPVDVSTIKNAAVAKLVPFLVLSEDLPSGKMYGIDRKTLLADAGKPFEIYWKIRNAAREGGVWKILDAEPLPFQQVTALEYQYLEEAGKKPADLIRSETALRRIRSGQESALQAFSQRLTDIGNDVETFRAQRMAAVPGKPVKSTAKFGGSGSGEPTKSGMRVAGGAGTGAAIGAIAGGGEGAGWGALGGAIFGGIYDAISKSNDEAKFKKAQESEYQSRLAARNAALNAATREANAYGARLMKQFEDELRARAQAHNNRLREDWGSLPVNGKL